MLLAIIIATVIISLMSFVGIFFLSERVKQFLHYLVSFAAGTLLAVAFFDLIPESLEHFLELGIDLHESIIIVLAGVLIFFLIERFIHWHHCDSCTDHDHHHDHKHKTAGFLVLAGDFVHNFVDGVLVAGAFLLDFHIGIVTTLSIVAHEIPQEIGDFSILLHSGYTKAKALLYNFYSALSAVLGGVIGYFALSAVQSIVPFVVAIAAGGFIYIALTHIVPALHSHKHNRKTIFIETLIFFSTIVVFYFLLAGHSH
ncbi:MAG: ZIP family metal transporter [Nanoarchaeota archaeon]|nr:ZIP family metal transporter [Nanoarchaeota archaeon]